MMSRFDRHSYHVVILFYPLGPSVQINSMNTFSLGLYFISIFSCLLSYHCNIINGAHNISEQDFIKSPAQDVITAYALADSYERNRSEDCFNLKETSDLDEGHPVATRAISTYCTYVNTCAHNTPFLEDS